MFFVSRFVSWLNSLLLVLLLASCAKQEAQPAGALEATILPAKAALMAVATAADGRVYQVVPDTTTGWFRFADLPAGNYQLTFTTIAAYLPPVRPVQLTIAAGRILTPTLDPLDRNYSVQGSMSWLLDGLRYETTQWAEVRISESSGIYLRTLIPTPGGQHMLAMSIPFFRGSVGRYELGVPYSSSTPQVANRLAYWQYFPNGVSWNFQTPYDSVLPTGGGFGTFTVTRFDRQNFRIVGTFEGTMQRYLGDGSGPAQVVISQGRFDIRF